MTELELLWIARGFRTVLARFTERRRAEETRKRYRRIYQGGRLYIRLRVQP